jgi:hypothetical protein
VVSTASGGSLGVLDGIGYQVGCGVFSAVVGAFGSGDGKRLTSIVCSNVHVVHVFVDFSLISLFYFILFSYFVVDTLQNQSVLFVGMRCV